MCSGAGFRHLGRGLLRRQDEEQRTCCWELRGVTRTLIIWVCSVFAFEEKCPQVFRWDVDGGIIGGDGHNAGKVRQADPGKVRLKGEQVGKR